MNEKGAQNGTRKPVRNGMESVNRECYYSRHDAG